MYPTYEDSHTGMDGHGVGFSMDYPRVNSTFAMQYEWYIVGLSSQDADLQLIFHSFVLVYQRVI